MKAFAPLGRLLFSAMFIISGFNHFAQFDALVGYARSSGVPVPAVAVIVSGLTLLVGGLCVLLGVFTRIAAAGIAAFLIAAALLVHDFWTFADPQEAQQQMAHFLKNLSMAGGALLLVAFGPGPLSIRSRRAGARRHSFAIRHEPAR
jgi:putative oxidoreductase